MSFAASGSTVQKMTTSDCAVKISVMVLGNWGAEDDETSPEM